MTTSLMLQRKSTREPGNGQASFASIAIAIGGFAVSRPPPRNPRRTARPCARSTSACRWRRRTWCTPRPTWRRRWAIFAKRCIDANIVQFEGGQSQTSAVAAAQGTAIVSVSDVSIGRGLKVQQIWGLAPRMPQAYMVQEGITRGGRAQGQAAVRDRRRRRRLQLAHGPRGAEVRQARPSSDAQFIPSPTAGRLPGLIANQIDGVALHPGGRVPRQAAEADAATTLVQLVELMPNYMFNAYGASTEWIARDRALLRDTVAAMIEANRTIYREKDKVIPIMVEATKKPKEAVEFAWKSEHRQLRLVGQHRLRSEAHAMVDRQQRGERRHRGGEEADCRAGRQHQARRGGDGAGRRAGDDRKCTEYDSGESSHARSGRCAILRRARASG